MLYKCHSGKSNSAQVPLVDECKCVLFAIPADPCPNDYAAEATIFLSVEILGRILIVRTDDLARKIRNQRTAVRRDTSKAPSTMFK